MDHKYILKADVKEVVSEISHLINNMNEEYLKEFPKEMGREHRTLQQSFTRLCVAWFEHLAKLDDNYFDLRNKANRELAKAIIERCEDKLGLPFI